MDTSEKAPKSEVDILREALATLLATTEHLEKCNAMREPHEYRRALYAASVARGRAHELTQGEA